MQFSLQSRYQKSPSISIKGPDPQQPLLDRPSQQPFQLKRSKPPSPKLQEPAPSQPQPRADRSLTEKLEPEVAIMLFAGIAFVVATTIASVASAADNGINTNLVQQLKVATTNMDRMDLLPKSSDWFFDFTKSDKYTFSPGGVAYAEAATFPATIGYGISMSIINLGPCAMLPPHIHPRATKYAVAVKGTTHTWMITENGAPVIEETLTAGQMTIFPQAAIHSMMNVGCEDAQLICSFNSEDPGTINLANAIFDMPANITQTILGEGVDVHTVAGQIPGVGTGSNAGPEQCLKTCAAKGKFIGSASS